MLVSFTIWYSQRTNSTNFIDVDNSKTMLYKAICQFIRNGRFLSSYWIEV
uniref:Uncharacterized protein n=1 Tax=Lepeophtheirus salmonis TaxID=72036 RepID=A0A0K2T8S2_LEPSM